MNYQEFRPSIKSGDLLAWTHRKWGSWYDLKVQLIRIFTRSEYVHVAVAWVVGGRVFALEAVTPVLRIFPLSKLGDFYHVSLNASWTPEVEEYAMSHVGAKYSQMSAVASLFQQVGDSQVDECAAYAINVLKGAGVDLGNKAIPSDVVTSALRTGALTMVINSPVKTGDVG